MEAKINKAQEKRDRQNTEFINSQLRRKLMTFENEYLNSCVAFEFNSRKAIIKSIEKEIIEFPKSEKGLKMTEHGIKTMINNFEYRIDRIQNELKFDATITMNALNYAKKSFDEKVDRLVSLLVKEGFGYSHFQVEEIKSRTSKLEFLISKSDKEVHARLIWVDGVEVCSHFRFITTTRKK
ncbi:hypothetical protein HWC99_gp19 [Flavobacterium phage vB_FspS_tant8-1]|uniref:Uncharacterized protein n=1 Tax=Flavobacterium phage vB_FspS_tant8-1 TaxID=2686278 RepID=A0A6B9LGU8_9CAUD|nr:hypothetical protein HWC99_gp19 [Flavobacterium phage vB_FspS_tant8-1]QHB40950.1 hypothetical protein tant81_gp019 [Flavobacterium phage vB_FspS_tant8-1]